MPKLRALLRVSNADCTYQSTILTHWSEESRLQLQFLQWPLDAYSVKVESIVHCQVEEIRLKRPHRAHDGHGGDACGTEVSRPVFVPCHAGSLARMAPLARPALFDWQTQNAAAETEVEGDVEMCSESDDFHMDIDEGGIALPAGATSWQDILREWQLDLEIKQLPIILVPEPIAFLILQGRWHHIVSRLSWQRGLWAEKRVSALLPMWPPPGSEPWRHVGQHLPKVDDQMFDYNPCVCVAMANNLRRWSSTLLADAALLGQEAEELQHLQQAVGHLEAWANVTASWAVTN